MTISAVATTTHTLTAAVTDTSTFTVAYPTGFNQAALQTTSGGEVVVGENDVWGEADPGFAFSFGASNITVTNNTGATLPIGTELRLSFGEYTNDGSMNPVMQVAGPVSLTDSSGGTAADTIAAIGATYDQAEVRDAVASLAAKVNAIIAALESAGVLRD